MSSSSRVLKDKGFMLQERGEIDVKGKGRMSTYFLEGNLTSTEHEIMGRSVKEADSGRASVQSARDCSTEAALYRPGKQGSPVCLPLNYSTTKNTHLYKNTVHLRKFLRCVSHLVAPYLSNSLGCSASDALSQQVFCSLIFMAHLAIITTETNTNPILASLSWLWYIVNASL